MIPAMKPFRLAPLYGLLLLFGCSVPALAGTAIKAHVQSFTPVNSWTNVEVSIDSDRMRLDFKGPTAHGSLIYDRDSSQLTVVD